MSDKILKDRAYKIAINPKYNGQKEDQQAQCTSFLTRKLDRQQEGSRVYARFKDNFWAVDLAKMGSLSSTNQGIKYLLCLIDVFTKYAQIKPLKYKKAKTVLNNFIKIVNASNSKCR